MLALWLIQNCFYGRFQFVVYCALLSILYSKLVYLLLV